MEDAISIDFFISHSVQDRVLADAARAFLERQGFRCWKAPDDILPGQLWEDAIVDAIEQSRGILLIWTQASQDSAQVRRELSVASACCKDIFPLRIGEIFPEGVFKFYLLRTQWIDSSSEDLEEGLGRIVGAALDNWSLDPSESGAMDRDLVSCETFKPAEACISGRQSPDPALRPSGLSRYVMERRGHRFNVDLRALLLAIAAALVVLAVFCFVQRDQLLSRFSGGYEQVQFALSSKVVRAVIGFTSDRIAIKDILKEFSYGLDKVFAAADEGGLGQVPSILDEHAVSFGPDSQLVGDEYLEQCFALLGQQGSEVDAIYLSNQSLALGDSANAYFCRAYAKADLGHHRGAIADYTRALLIAPRYDTAYYNRGIEKSVVGNEKRLLPISTRPSRWWLVKPLITGLVAAPRCGLAISRARFLISVKRLLLTHI